jgi:hypothetical protein
MLGGAAVNALFIGFVGLLALVTVGARVRTTRDAVTSAAAQGKTSRDATPEMIAGWILVIVALLMPASLFEVVNPGERILGPAAVLLVLAWPASRLGRWFGTAAGAFALIGLVLTAVSGLLLPAKAAQGDPTPQTGTVELSKDPAERTSILFGHRLDQFEERVGTSDQLWREDAPPDRVPTFKTWVLRQGS